VDTAGRAKGGDVSTHTGTPCTCPDCQPGPAGDIRTRLTPVLERLDGTDAATVRHIVAVLTAERDELTEMLTAATDTAVQRGKRIDELSYDLLMMRHDRDVLENQLLDGGDG
jgi:hypothetical protein